MAQPGKAELVARKRDIRADAKARRAAAAGDPGRAAQALRERVLRALSLPRGRVVSAYWPMGSEIDPRPLMRELHRRGHPIVLPVVVGRDRALVFRAWRPGDALAPGGFGTQVPRAGQPELVPGVLIVPLLAFDRAGYRLGYGGGFYDRTLARLRHDGEILAVGVAYAAQEVAAVPHDADDQPLDWIVTEAEAIEVG